MGNITVVNHPIIQHHLSILRDHRTYEYDFRLRLKYICQLMFFEVTKEIQTKSIKITTPLESMEGQILKNDLIIVTILRAGLGMQEAFLNLFPEAAIGHLGFYRNEETLQPVRYYYNLPKNLADSEIILADPMLATGGSLNAAIALLKEHGAKRIKCVTLVSVQQGIDFVLSNHPDVAIYTAALDRELNNKGYILPGLGDAGDRQFRT